MEYPYKLVLDYTRAWDGNHTYTHADLGGARAHLAEIKAGSPLAIRAGVFVVNPAFVPGEASGSNPKLIPV